DALRLVLFAGEGFPMKYFRQLADVLPHTQLYNLYGPTETNVCTDHPVGRFRLAGQEKLPIGRACSHTQVVAGGTDGEPEGVGGAASASASAGAPPSRRAPGPIPTRPPARWCPTPLPPT